MFNTSGYFHHKLCKQYDESVIGSRQEMSRMASIIYESCFPRPDGELSSGYRNFVDSAEKYFVTKGETVSKEDIMRLISPRRFGELMEAFATGVQYAARKTGKAEDSKGSILVFRHNATDAKGAEVHNFIAMAAHIPEKNLSAIIINPESILEAVMNPGIFLKDHVEFTNLNTSEKFIMLGIEEQLHLQQMGKGRKATYDLSNLDHNAYESDPMEREADMLQNIARHELFIGAEYRGLAR